MIKRIIGIIFAAFSLFFAVPLYSCATELTVDDSEISEQVDDILADTGVDLTFADIGGLTCVELIEKVRDSLSGQLNAPVKMLGTLLLVIVFSALMKSCGETFFTESSGNNIYSMVCVMTSAAVIMPHFFTIYDETIAVIDTTGRFISVFVPVFTGISIASGGAATAGAYNMMILVASELAVQLVSRLLMPILSIMASLSITGSVFSNNSVDSIAALLKKAVTWALTISAALFTGFVSLKCTLTGKADGAATKAVKFVISGSVPVVGSAVSDAYSTVRSSFEVIRTTVGTAGCAAIAVIMLPPILRIMAYRLVMWTGSAAAEMFSAEPMGKLLKSLDSGLAIAQSVLVCYSLMFVLCSAILMQSL